MCLYEEAKKSPSNNNNNNDKTSPKDAHLYQ